MPQVDKHKMVILNQEAETQTARTEKLAFLSTMCSVSLRKLETGQVEDKKKKSMNAKSTSEEHYPKVTYGKIHKNWTEN